jgi:hypothetical protein
VKTAKTAKKTMKQRYREALEMLDECRSQLARAGCCERDALDSMPKSTELSDRIDALLEAHGYEG